MPWGYSWASRDLTTKAVFERALLIHGIDQGTAAHGSGKIAALCGVASAEFRAPAIAAVVANAMMTRFPDRALPSVSLGPNPLNPKAITTTSIPVSSNANPIFLDSVSGLTYTLSQTPDSAWAGLRERDDIDELDFAGAMMGKKLPATVVEAEALRAIRAQRGRSSAGTDAMLEGLYDTYKGVSRTLAREVVDILNKTQGVEYLPAKIPWAPNSGRFGYTIGYADGGSNTYWDGMFDLSLRLLKSDLTTSVTMRVPGAGNYSYDTHDPPAHEPHVNNLRGTFEVLGRLFLEMMMTPSKSQPGKSLLDETQVHIFSDFGRTWAPKGSDHHPATTMMLLGGNVNGNRMIGGYDETIDIAKTSPLGVPVDIIDIEEGGSATSKRVPRASDAAATVLRCFGLEAGKDFFIPGGYGEIAGVLG
ncbi:Hypothetical protein A7982_04694 [Minicystis rosea]|nr:Hypothetical protein A7982_04694 [Minicystis rosea]